MSGEPSTAELSAFAYLADTATWSGLPGQQDDVNEPFGSLLELLGATADMPLHTIGMVPESGFDLALSAWMIGGNPPSFIMKSIVTTFGRACRIRAGVQLSMVDIAAPAAALASQQQIVVAQHPAPPLSASVR